MRVERTGPNGNMFARKIPPFAGPARNQRAGAPGTAGTGTGATAGAFRENSDVLLRYQINAPPPTTATKVKKTMRMPRQDFMRKFLRRSRVAS